MTLNERRKRIESKADNLKKYLDRCLQGDRFKTSKVEISYRKSTSLVSDNEFINWAKQNAPNLLVYTAPSIDKTAVKNEIKTGKQFDFARIIEKNNIQVR